MLTMRPAVGRTKEVTPRVMTRLVDGDGSRCFKSRDRNWDPVEAEAHGCCNVVSHWIKKGANERPASDKLAVIGFNATSSGFRYVAERGLLTATPAARQGSCLMTVALNGAANISNRGV